MPFLLLQLLPLSVIIDKIREKLFKPNCALGENEPSFLEIMTRLHGRFDFSNW